MLFVIKHIVFFLLPLFCLRYGKSDLREYVINGYAQGTTYSIKYFAVDSAVTRKAVDSILAVIDTSMSLYKPYSTICRFNAADKGLTLDTHFVRVMQRSFAIYKDTKGKFDATVEPLVQAWGFGVKPITKFPDSMEVKQLLKCVGMNNLILKGDYLSKKRSCIKIDLNGIAQGYSVDVITDYLIRKSIKSFVVELGGELRTKGPKPDGTPLRIGIEGPAASADAEPVIRHVVHLNEGAITTAGNYRKYLQQGTKKITHLIDPKTGYPLDNALISVTIWAKDATTADGYDSPIMAMNVKEAIAFVNARKNMEAYIIYKRADGSITDTLTNGFRKMIVN